MLSRIVKLIEARRALRSGRLHEALALADDSAIREDRRARELREEARARLLERAEDLRSRGEISAALLDVQSFLSGAPDEDRRGRELMDKLRAAVRSRDELREMERLAIEEARRHFARGWLYEARARLAAHAQHSEAAVRLAEEIDAAIARADRELDRAADALKRGEKGVAKEALQSLRALCPSHPGRERLEREFLRGELSAVLAEVAAAVDEDALERAWSALSARAAEQPEVADLSEWSEALKRLRDLREERIRDVLLHGDLSAIGAAARRWYAMDPASGAELPPALATAVEALTEAAALSELALEKAPQLRLRRVSGDHAIESGLLQASERLEREAEGVRQFVRRAERAVMEADLLAWKEACSIALAAYPAAFVFARLLSAATQAPSDAASLAAVALDGGHALRALMSSFHSGGPGEFPRIAWERIERARAEFEGTFALFAEGALDDAERARCAQRIAALMSLASDVPWIETIQRVLDGLARAEQDHRALQACLVSGAWSAAEDLLVKRELEFRAARGSGIESPLAVLFESRLERDQRLFARALRSAYEREGWRALIAWLGNAGPAPDLAPKSALYREDWKQRLSRRRSKVRQEIERRRASGAALSNDEWDEARLLLPGDELLVDLMPRSRELAALDERVRRAEWMSDRRDYSGAWDELHSIEDAGPFRTRIFDLKRRVQRELGLGERFFLRIEEGGEYLVLLQDKIRIGNARVAGNDLPILANISSHHAEIERTVNFHEGVRYRVRGIDARPIAIDGAPMGPEGHVLQDREVMRLGPALAISFHQPSERSQSAVLRMRDGFDVQGVERVILMKSGGKAGRLLFGTEDRAHLRSPLAVDIELWMDAEQRLRGQASSPWKIDGHLIDSPVPVLPAGAWVECGGVRFVVEGG